VKRRRPASVKAADAVGAAAAAVIAIATTPLPASAVQRRPQRATASP
jgi:hypothetical protein